MRMLRLTAIAAGTAILTATLAAAGVAEAAQRGVSNKEIVIGTHTALSGPVAPWGVGSINGIRMRFDAVNAAGGINGRKLRFVVEDNQYQVPRAVQAVNKLINRDKIFFMLAGLGTPMNNAVLKRQIGAKVPNLFPFSAARQMFQPFHRLKFAGGSTYYDQIRAGVKYFVDQKGKSKVCTMYQDTDFGREIFLGVRDQLKDMGMPLVSESAHKPTDTDFSAVMLKHKNAGCDVITMGTIIRDTILPMATAKKMGWDVTFVGTIANFDSIVASAKGGVTEGFYAMTWLVMPYEDHETPTVRQWYQDYSAKYGLPPSQAAMLGYILADITVTALDRAGRDLTVDSLVAAIESIKSYRDKFGGPIQSFSSEKHFGSNQAFLAEVKGGRWVKTTGNLGY